MKNYTQLTRKQRAQIAKLRTFKKTISEIAHRVGVHRSTVLRELKRNGEMRTCDHRVYKELAELYVDPLMRKALENVPDEERTFCYQVQLAQKRATLRRYWSNQARTRKHKRIRDWVIKCLKKGWSPSQIAGRSKLEGRESISHETVYQIICRDKKSRRNALSTTA